MDISWPGLIIGTLMTAACIFAFRKRDAISGFANSQPEFFLGKKVATKVDTGPERMKAALLLPILGGIVMGAVLVILSLTGVMARSAHDGPDPLSQGFDPLVLVFIVLVLIALGFGALGLIQTVVRRTNPPTPAQLRGLGLAGMGFMVAAGVVFYFITSS